MNLKKDDLLEHKTTGDVSTVTEVGPGGQVRIKGEHGYMLVTEAGLLNYTLVSTRSHDHRNQRNLWPEAGPMVGCVPMPVEVVGVQVCSYAACALPAAPRDYLCEGHRAENTPPVEKPAERRYSVREDVLTTAMKHVMGDRNNAYGPPTQDFDRTAGMLNALYKHKLKPDERFVGSDIARIMMCVKLSRSTHAAKRDNWDDAAGYAACAAECEEAEA